ncbi:MAG: InlB B-repeat-containing protein [Lachnospiraceae bacterium]|nr:InlB B-repeat-containing protein [Lachnospiraceae bacterium]
MKKRILAVLFSVIMIATLIPTSVFAGIETYDLETAEAGSPIDVLFPIYSSGEEVQELEIVGDELLTVSVDSADDYQWQIRIPGTEEYADIDGRNAEECCLTYPLLRNILDDDLQAELRCHMFLNDEEYYSRPVTITYYEESDVLAGYAQIYSAPRRMAFAMAPLGVSDGEGSLTDTLTIKYLYENEGPDQTGSVAAPYEEAFQTAISSPVLDGYIPYLVDASVWDENEERWMIDESTALRAETVDVDIDNVDGNETYYVVYVAQDTTYTVHFFLQNVEDDNYAYYDSRTETAKTGASVPADLDYSAEFPGFTQLEYEGATVAADGSTEISVDFARDYYLMNFRLDGGYGVAPIYARYNASVRAGVPIRAGYMFDGWEVIFPEDLSDDEVAELESISDNEVSVPSYNVTLEAKWKTTDSSYTIVYWRQNANDDEYAYWGSKTVSADSESVVSGQQATAADVGVTSTVFTYFSYNDELTDKNVVVAGDGSSVVNVYYDRNLYTFNFVGYGQCCLEEDENHTHTADCFFDYENGIHTHNQFCYVLPEGYSVDTAISKSDSYLLSDGTSSPIYRLRYLEDSSLGISFGYLQKEEGGDRYYYINWDKNDGKGKKYYYLNDADGQVHYPAGTDRSNFESSFALEFGTCSYPQNVIYSFQAKYEQNIGDIWPIISVLNAQNNVYKTDGNASDTNGNIFSKWALQGVEVNSSSKRLTIPSDFCRAAVDGVVTNDAIYAASLNDCVLNYMFESFDQETASTNETMRRTIIDHYTTSFRYSDSYDQNDFAIDRVKYYDQDMLYHENTKLDSQGVTNKGIAGFNSVGRIYENIKDESGKTTYVEYLYYVRKRSKLTFYNVDAASLVVNNVMYEMPLSDIKDANGNNISEYIPSYPSSYEPNAYVFGGWYTTPGCFSGTEVTFDETMPANDMMLYAKWTRVNHNVRVFKNCEDMNAYTALETPDEAFVFFQEEVGHGSVATLYQLPTKKGYLFDGWYYMDNGVKKAFTFNDTAVTKDMDIFAEWQVNNHPVHNEVTVSATVGNLTIQVTGDLPVTSTLSASLHEVPNGLLPDNSEDISIVGLDLELYNQGYKFQPDDTVRVTISGIDTYENTWAEVIHVLDSADAIRDGIENGTAVPVDMSVFVNGHPEEMALTQNVTGEEDVVYVEDTSSSDNTLQINGNIVTFETNSFSTYYVVSGNTTNGSTTAEVVYIYDSIDDTYYVAPGTTIRFTRRNDWPWGRDADYTWAKYGTNTVSGITATFNNGQNITNQYVRASNGRPNIIISIPTSATGGTYTLYTERGMFWGAQQSITTIIVKPQEEVIQGTLDNSQYPVYLGFLENSASLPSEPALTQPALDYFSGSSYSIVTNETTFATTTNGIVDPSITTNSNLVNSADGTNTVGIVDNTGVNTKATLSGINWDTVLNQIAAANKYYADNGEKVTPSNKSNFEVIPYVVKLQTAYGLGWHIYCYVKAKDSVTLSYNADFAEGVAANYFALPNPYNAIPTFSTTVGYATYSENHTNVNVGTSVPITYQGASYSATFTGWNTKSDGSGDQYGPGDTIEVSTNTVLYAQWNYSMPLGTGYIEVHKNVMKAEYSEDIPSSLSFTMRVSFSDGNTYSGKKYNRNGGYIADVSSSSFTLADGEYARFNIPSGVTCTAQETVVPPYYTVSYSGNEVTIVGGSTSQIQVTNTYKKLIEYPITYNLDGGTVTPANPTTYNVETATITLNNPTKAGYIFLGWTGSNGTTPETTATIPTGSTGNKNYTANWKRETASLTVQKSGWNSIDENQAFIFHVKGLDIDNASVEMDIVVIGNGSTTIAELPTGRYLVAENSNWSWRYASESAKEVTVTLNGTNEVTFNNTRTITQWLNGQASAINKK